MFTYLIFPDECGLDALCDLLDDDDNPNESGVEHCDNVPESHAGASSLTDLEMKMMKMQDEMKMLEKQIQVKKDSSEPYSVHQDSGNASKLRDLGINIFESPTIENVSMSKEVRSIASMDFDEEVNPYIETPQLTESGMTIEKVLRRERDDSKRGTEICTILCCYTIHRYNLEVILIM